MIYWRVSRDLILIRLFTVLSILSLMNTQLVLKLTCSFTLILYLHVRILLFSLQLGFNIRGGQEHHCGIFVSKVRVLISLDEKNARFSDWLQIFYHNVHFNLISFQRDINDRNLLKLTITVYCKPTIIRDDFFRDIPEMDLFAATYFRDEALFTLISL